VRHKSRKARRREKSLDYEVSHLNGGHVHPSWKEFLVKSLPLIRNKIR
jgi:hypothetical protein